MSMGSMDPVSLRALSGLGPELAAAFVSIASDIALVIGPDGVIRNVAVGPARLRSSADDWVGRPWAETVTADTRRKIEQLLEEVADSGQSARREVSVPSGSGGDIPVAYSAIRLGEFGPVLAVGRDLGSIAAIQQRFVDAQKELERDYWRQRQVESRYRMLFQVANDAVLLVDAESFAVIEANDAARRLISLAASAQPAGSVLDGFADDARPAVQALLATARTTGRPSEIRARLAGGDAIVAISATPFRSTTRAETEMLLLVRVRRAEREPAAAADGRTLSDFVERTPDAVVITDSAGRVIMGNPAFARLGLTLGCAGDVKGKLIGEVLDDASGEISSLLHDVRQGGVIGRRIASVGAPGAARCEIEVSAAVLADADQECIGFTLRRVGGDGLQGLLGQSLARRIEHLLAQLGALALPDLLQQLSQIAERQIIEAALEKSDGSRTRAAELLGIGPESLALRLLRHHGGRLDAPPISHARDDD